MRSFQSKAFNNEQAMKPELLFHRWITFKQFFKQILTIKGL